MDRELALQVKVNRQLPQTIGKLLIGITAMSESETHRPQLASLAGRTSQGFDCGVR